MAFRVAPQAESDLDEIWYFLATQSSNIDVADRVIDSIAKLEKQNVALGEQLTTLQKSNHTRVAIEVCERL
jgi:plasmid stabilization system protein ParE